MKIKDNGEYNTFQFQSLLLGDVFVFAGNTYMVCRENLDSNNNPYNAVNLRTGEFTYFNNEKCVMYYANAIVHLNL